MSLMECPFCESEIYKKAEKCYQCGANFHQSLEELLELSEDDPLWIISQSELTDYFPIENLFGEMIHKVTIGWFKFLSWLILVGGIKFVESETESLTISAISLITVNLFYVHVGLYVLSFIISRLLFLCAYIFQVEGKNFRKRLLYGLSTVLAIIVMLNVHVILEFAIQSLKDNFF